MLFKERVDQPFSRIFFFPLQDFVNFKVTRLPNGQTIQVSQLQVVLPSNGSKFEKSEEYTCNTKTMF